MRLSFLRTVFLSRAALAVDLGLALFVSFLLYYAVGSPVTETFKQNSVTVYATILGGGFSAGSILMGVITAYMSQLRDKRLWVLRRSKYALKQLITDQALGLGYLFCLMSLCLVGLTSTLGHETWFVLTVFALLLMFALSLARCVWEAVLLSDILLNGRGRPRKIRTPQSLRIAK